MARLCLGCLIICASLVRMVESFSLPAVKSWRQSRSVASMRCSEKEIVNRRRAIEHALLLPVSTCLRPTVSQAAAPPISSIWGVRLPATIDQSFVAGNDGVRFKEVYAGTGRTPSEGDSVRVLLSVFSEDGAAIGPIEKVEKFDLGREDIPAPLKAAILSMKMGAQRVLFMPSDSTRAAPSVVFVKLLAVVGHICSSEKEEIEKGNFLDFHTCGEVTESTERVRLFCEKVQCVEQSYLDVQSRNRK